MNKKSDLRRALISFSWTWLVFIALMAMISLFSIWSMNRAYEKSFARFSEAAELEDHALQAQIAFKVQVQEWKNVLLRGDDDQDRRKYFAAFEDQESEVQTHLAVIGQRSDIAELADYAASAKAIAAQHQLLGKSYREALPQAGGLDLTRARTADRQVRGLDRGLEEGINRLATDISALADRIASSNLEQLHERYLGLRNFIAISMLIVLVITAASLYGVLRATRD